jgi:hypothetical protein
LGVLVPVVCVPWGVRCRSTVDAAGRWPFGGGRDHEEGDVSCPLEPLPGFGSGGGRLSGGTAVAEPPATLLNPFGEDVPGPGGLVRSDVDCMRACGKWRSARRAFVATNLRVCRSNNRNRRSDRLVERSGGFLHTTGQRSIPRTVATNLQVCRSNNRDGRSDSLMERSGGFFHATGQRPIPRTWRRTSRFVGPVVATSSSSSRNLAVTSGRTLAAEPDPTDLVSVVKKVCG